MQACRFNNGKYVNWVKTSLSLLYLKEGITKFSDEKAVEFHKDVTDRVRLRDARAATTKCTKCNHKCAIKTKTPDKKNTTWRMNCSSNVCNVWLEEIVSYHMHLPLPNIAWANSNPQMWQSNAWELAKLFQPYGCEKHSNAEESDCVALLSMMLDCRFFNKFINNTALLQEIKDVRNACMHSRDQEIDDQDMKRALGLMVSLLEEPSLKTRQECIAAKKKITELRDNVLELSLHKDMEIHVLNNRFAEVSRDIKQCTDEYQQLQTELSKDRQDCTEFRDQMTKLRQWTTELKEEMKSLQTTFKDLNLSKKLPDIEKQLDQIVHLEIEAKTVQERSEQNTESIKKVNSRVDSIEHDMKNESAEVKSRLSTVEEGSKQNAGVIQKVVSRVDSIDHEMEKMKSDISDAQRKHTKLVGKPSLYSEYGVDAANLLAMVEHLTSAIESSDHKYSGDIPILKIRVRITGTKAVTESLLTMFEKVDKYKRDGIGHPNDVTSVWKAVQQLFNLFETIDASTGSFQREDISLNIKCQTLTGLQIVLTMFTKDGYKDHLVDIESALSDLYKEKMRVTLVLPDDTLQQMAEWTGAAILSFTCDSVTIVPRAEWGARPSKQIDYMETPVGVVFIHHTVMAECRTLQTGIRDVRTIQNMHMDTNGWDDIGYNFLIANDGRVYEARGWDRVGAHTYGWNKISVAFAFMGNYSYKLPDDAAIHAVQRMMDLGVKLGKLTSDYKLYGHRDVRFCESPGQRLYDLITTWEHYDTNTPVKPTTLP